MDARVIDVRARAPASDESDLFDALAYSTQIVCDDLGGEHVRVDHEGGVLRFDVIDGTVRDGAVALRFDIPNDARLPVRLNAIHVIHAVLAGHIVTASAKAWTAGVLLALHAYDDREEGASLRDIANHLLGPGAWPGDGDHRKSRVRRLVKIGKNLIDNGPSGTFERFSEYRLKDLSSAVGAFRYRDSSPAGQADRC